MPKHFNVNPVHLAVVMKMAESDLGRSSADKEHTALYAAVALKAVESLNALNVRGKISDETALEVLREAGKTIKSKDKSDLALYRWLIPSLSRYADDQYGLHTLDKELSLRKELQHSYSTRQ